MREKMPPLIVISDDEDDNIAQSSSPKDIIPAPIIISDDEGDDVDSASSQTFLDAGLMSMTRRSKRLLLAESSSDFEPDDDALSAAAEECIRPPKVARRALSHVQVTGPAYPRSAYEGWQPPLQRSKERNAVSDLHAVHEAMHSQADEQPEYVYFELDDFSIYNAQQPGHKDELVTLHKLQNRNGHSQYVFDGILRVGTEKRFVQGVRFSVIQIDGYCDPDVSYTGSCICIQSPQARVKNVWYRLGKPSAVYERFYGPFLWLVQFTKYFVNYLQATDIVTLHHFRADFGQWLRENHSSCIDFVGWHKQCGNLKDFRTTVAANIGFLKKECSGINEDDEGQQSVDLNTGFFKHAIWSETCPNELDAIPMQQHDLDAPTSVTPFVYDCFKYMYFHKQMRVEQVTDEKVLDAIAKRKAAMGLTPFGAKQAPEATILTPQSMTQDQNDEIVDVRMGDVVCVPAEQDGPWRSISPIWMAYVQRIRHLKRRTVLDVLWLYEAHDTTLGFSTTPFKNELFMSNNCGCGKEAIDLDQVIGKADVTWFAKDPSQQSGLFVRQTFRTLEDKDVNYFQSLQESDFRCRCSEGICDFEECRKNYQIGEAVLVEQWHAELGTKVLEPSQIINFELEERHVKLRRMLRKQQLDANAPPNELLLSDKTFTTLPEDIIRKCYVKIFTPEQVQDGVPSPFNRRGTGDFFYAIDPRSAAPEDTSENGNRVQSTHSTDRDDQGRASQDVDLRHGNIDASTRDHVGSSSSFPPIECYLNPIALEKERKLKGMGIFCGGGNFDRGIEDGGAVDFKYAVDINSQAIHSYRANVKDPPDMRFYYGSVNDYLRRAMAGEDCDLIARVGDVCIICAGSPCPGFSTMQLNKQSEQSLRNASLVASVISYVDVYSPKYLILENVIGMTHTIGSKDGSQGENVFAQILAALVALGYQVQQNLMDAWNYGDPQSRSRVFIIATAPGLQPLDRTQHTHAHLPKVSNKALGKSSNGRQFGVRRLSDATPFPYVSAAEATEDLPNIQDAQPQLCPTFPDHRTPSEEGADARARIAQVPKQPGGMGLVQAAHLGKLTGDALKWVEQANKLKRAKCSRAYSRVKPDGLFRTVTTALNLSDAIVGTTLHWDQDRSLTIMELKRAQGFLDEDVIVGTPSDQVRIIGNSVARNVAFALGLSLRESWVKSFQQDPPSYTTEDPIDSWQSAVVSLRSSPVSNTDDGGTNRSRISSVKITLSQEERMQIREDPSHGFRTINRLVSSRGDESSFADGMLDGEVT